LKGPITARGDVVPSPGDFALLHEREMPQKDQLCGALSDALDHLLEDRGLRSGMSAAARRRVAALPRWEETVSGFYEVLREAASRGPDPARRGRVSL
jgi:hypothetical protein